MSTRYWSLILLLSLIWGTSFLFIEFALDGGYEPLTIVAIRTFLALIVLVGFLLVRKKGFWFLWRKRYLLLVSGLFNAILPFGFFAFGQQYIDSSVAAFIDALTPMATMVVALALRHETLAINKLFAFSLAILGAGVLFIPSFGDMSQGTVLGISAVLVGNLAALLATVSYGIGAVFISKYLADTKPEETVTGSVFFALIITVPFAFIFESPLSVSPDLISTLSIVGLGVFGTGVAVYIYFSLISNYGATNATTEDFIVPIVAFLLGFFVRGERLGSEFYIGAAIIFVALIVLDKRLIKFAHKLVKRLV